MTTSYDTGIQKLFLEMMMQDSQSFVRVQNIYNVDNFDRSLRVPAEFIKNHCAKHNTMPTFEQVNAVCKSDLQPAPGLNEDHYNWFLDEFEGFTKQKELERAILKAADLLEKGEYEPVEKLIKDAVQISLTKDMGTDYFADPKSRLMRIKDNNGQVSTGWNNLDRKLFGGFNRGELNIFAGGSGSGKSLFMQNISVNWVLHGLNGVYITLELSEELTSMRIDSMLSNVSSKDIFKDIDNVDMKIRMMGKKAGDLQIKYMPAQSNVNDIRAYLKELQIKSGKKLDFVMLDYMDLLMPVSAKVSPSDLFVKDKYVAEEVRNLAKELQMLLVTASQLNRSAVEEIEFDHSHIAGGISKINTADNVFGIFTSRAMKERGRYQIQCMKSRSSTGVGQKIDLEYNIETMRITDPGEEGQESNGGYKPATSILNSIKTSTSVKPNIDADSGEILSGPTPSSSVESTRLKQMLAGLKAKTE